VKREGEKKKESDSTGVKCETWLEDFSTLRGCGRFTLQKKQTQSTVLLRLQALTGEILDMQLPCPDKTEVLEGVARKKSSGMWDFNVQNRGTFKVGRLWAAAAAQSGLED